MGLGCKAAQNLSALGGAGGRTAKTKQELDECGVVSKHAEAGGFLVLIAVIVRQLRNLLALSFVPPLSICGGNKCLRDDSSALEAWLSQLAADDTLLLLIANRSGKETCRIGSPAGKHQPLALTSNRHHPLLGPSWMSALPAGLRRPSKRLPNKCYTRYKYLATLRLNPSMKLPTREVRHGQSCQKSLFPVSSYEAEVHFRLLEA